MDAKGAKDAIGNADVAYSDAQCAALAVIVLGSCEGVIPSYRIYSVLRRWRGDDECYLMAYASMSESALDILREHGGL